MKPEAQRIAIAEACGWVEIHKLQGTDYTPYGWHPVNHPRKIHKYETLLPDYLTDLNAMHEAEERLYDIAGAMSLYTDLLEGGFRATAAQRAEAFLRTIGKWEESI